MRIGKNPFQCDGLIGISRIGKPVRDDQPPLPQSGADDGREMGGMIRSEQQCFGNRIDMLGDGAPDLLTDPGGTRLARKQGGQIPEVFF